MRDFTLILGQPKGACFAAWPFAVHRLRWESATHAPILEGLSRRDLALGP